MAELIRVLVIDDSAYVRKVVSQMLSRSPFIEVVGIARDGQEALELAKELTPDVITCDLNMPVMDGVSFVQAQMAQGAHPDRHHQHCRRVGRTGPRGARRWSGGLRAEADSAGDRKAAATSRETSWRR